MTSSSFSQVLVKEPGNAARALARYRARLAELDAGAKTRTYERRDELERHAQRLVDAFRDTGRCEMCGRQLEDEESLKRGVGPECLRKTSDATGDVLNDSETF